MGSKSDVFSIAEKAHFAQNNVADPFLVAKAMKYGYTVVTYEISANGGRKIKIPDVCKEFGVKCININDALRELCLRV